MMRQEPKLAVRVIKGRVRDNLFDYTEYAFRGMVDQMIYEEDVKHAVETSRLIETREADRKGTHYVLQGFAMNEEEMILVCRLLKRRVEIADVYWP